MRTTGHTPHSQTATHVITGMQAVGRPAQLEKTGASQQDSKTRNGITRPFCRGRLVSRFALYNALSPTA